MNFLYNLYQQHPAIFATVCTWIFNNIVTAFITSFPAPTKTSSTFYIWWFTFSNTVIGNIQRAKSTRIEQSPNWQDAVSQHIQNTQVNTQGTQNPSAGGGK